MGTTSKEKAEPLIQVGILQVQPKIDFLLSTGYSFVRNKTGTGVSLDKTTEKEPIDSTIIYGSLRGSLDEGAMDETPLDETSLDETPLGETSLDETSLDKTPLGETSLDETSEREEVLPGNYSVGIAGTKILFNGELFDELTFEADDPGNDAFELKNVVIGLQFHWERKEDQRFLGNLKFIVEQGGITAVNFVSLEDYLTSVISSEMSATSSKELLKAHAVISRSWLLAQIMKNKTLKGDKTGYRTSFETPTEIIRWYDREDHLHFDVCADDHCQRYQGITRQSTPLVQEVIELTRGEVLVFANKICDARFSKCCGGVMETFENVWEPVVHPYLQAKPDYRGTVEMEDTSLPSSYLQFDRHQKGLSQPTLSPLPNLTQEAYQPTLSNSTKNENQQPPLPDLSNKKFSQSEFSQLPDLTIEENAEKWIRSSPTAFCNTQDAQVLQQVLNDYDQETANFYRWEVSYTQEELSTLIWKRSGIDFGEIIALEPLERGTSGRITKLKIIGTERVMTIGKELEIRRTLSQSHLYSSAFVVDTQDEDENGIPQTFSLTGAGWGHGVGLCQIGAAIMAEKGYDYREILGHYFPGTEIKKNYE